MNRLGLIVSAIGLLLIISGLLYPIGVIGKETLIYLLLGGAGVMFLGSMIRSYMLYKKMKENAWVDKD